MIAMGTTDYAGAWMTRCGPVFLMCPPTQSARLAFIGENFYFRKVEVATYFILF